MPIFSSLHSSYSVKHKIFKVCNQTVMVSLLTPYVELTVRPAELALLSTPVIRENWPYAIIIDKNLTV